MSKITETYEIGGEKITITYSTNKRIPLDATIALLNAELEWCSIHPMADLVDRNFREGFIAGLRQAKHLIFGIAEMEF